MTIYIYGVEKNVKRQKFLVFYSGVEKNVKKKEEFDESIDDL